MTTRLTNGQKALIIDLHDERVGWTYWECSKAERRTTDALHRKGLLEYNGSPPPWEDYFEVRLTEAGLKVQCKLRG